MFGRFRNQHQDLFLAINLLGLVQYVSIKTKQSLIKLGKCKAKQEQLKHENVRSSSLFNTGNHSFSHSCCIDLTSIWVISVIPLLNAMCLGAVAGV